MNRMHAERWLLLCALGIAALGQISTLDDWGQATRPKFLAAAGMEILIALRMMFTKDQHDEWDGRERRRCPDGDRHPGNTD